MRYNWRIKLWDESDNEGEWTNGEDFFIMQGKRIQDLSYTYDDVGNIMRIDDQSETNTRKTAEYEYDELYRLTSATITDSATEEDYTQTYTYDSLGNFTNRSDVGDYEYEGNQGTNYANPHAVTSVQNDAVVINYDHNGNLLSEIISGYNWTIFEAGWDYNNRMITSGGWSAETLYRYDHSGQRILKDTGDEYSGITSIYANQYYNERTNKETSELTKTLNVYDNKGNLVATAEEAGETNNLYYVNGDHLGSSSVMTTDEGEQEQVVDYFPFGNMRFNEQRIQNESYDQKEKFSGKIFDQDAAGLSYFGARYYSGEAGKFISQDPVFLAVGDGEGYKKLTNFKFELYLSNPQLQNSYAYAADNPLKFIDTKGNIAETVWDAGCVAFDIGSYFHNELKAVGALFRGDLSGAVNHTNEAMGFLLNLGVDTGSAMIPFVPAGLSHVDDAAKATSLVRQNWAKGMQFENKVLNLLGESKNTQKISTQFGNVIPDIYNKAGNIIGEIKNTAYASLTNQFKGILEMVEKGKSQFTLYVNQNTKISGPLQKAIDTIKGTVQRITH